MWTSRVIGIGSLGLAGGLVAADYLFGAAETESGYFEGAQYSEKVLQQMQGGPGEFHSFPELVANFEDSGAVSEIVGGDGELYQQLEIPGSYATTGGRILDGVFQFLKDSDGIINHRVFVPN